MAVPSYGLIVDPKYIYFFESAQRALQHINQNDCASELWERPHHRYIALRNVHHSKLHRTSSPHDTAHTDPTFLHTGQHFGVDGQGLHPVI